MQSTLAVLLERELPLERMASVVAATPAERFSIEHKGRIAAGYDADLVLVDLRNKTTLRNDSLLYRHPVSPYAGCTFRGEVCRTIRRGETIYRDGAITGDQPGRLLRPSSRTYQAKGIRKG